MAKAKKESKEPIKTKTKVKSKKQKKKVTEGIAHILATFNNTMITITDLKGNTLVIMSPGHIGFKGSKKRTVFAATKAGEAAGLKAIEKYKMEQLKAYIKGAGMGRNAAVKGLASSGLRVTMIADVTKTPHNGCRPKRKPRK